MPTTVVLPLQTGGTVLNPLLVPNGTAALPAYAFSSDPTTGMFFTGTLLSWAVGGTSVMTLSSSGVFMTTGSISTGASSSYRWLNQSRMNSSADGFINFMNNTSSGFTQLTLGPETSSGITLAPSGGSMTIRRGDGGSISFLVNGSIQCAANSFIEAPGTNGSFGVFQSTSTLSGTLSGATANVGSTIIPANCLLVGVSLRVTTTITGATTFGIGDGTNATAYGATIALASGTTTNLANWTITAPKLYGTATNIVLTANGGNFTGGVVRVTLTYLQMVAPTS